uniref:AB hydrolase-1 domain-containing protein n=1 Tax=Rhodosorus marinus TaxID=101924 RepID=A0A7S3E6H2_9RHOD|mmetsp:Transcript_13099/g.52168  ORF Transcript_13099/g.52168 Transcript_13099/m.52168 type:complete len:292 (+) Transcript_13099:286-1161(+)
MANSTAFMGVENGEGVKTMTTVQRREVWYKSKWAVVLAIVLLVFAVFGLVLPRVRGGIESVINVVEDIEAPYFDKNKLESNVIEFRYGTIHYLYHKKPESKVSIIALHGPGETQSAEHWFKNLGLFDKMGSFYLMDLPGFGNSTASDTALHIPAYTGAQTISILMDEEGISDDPNQRIVIVARSWGAQVVMTFLSKNKKIADRKPYLIFVSPTPSLRKVHETLRAKLKSFEGILVFSAEDPYFPRSYIEVIRSYFPSLNLEILGGSSAHQPETEYPGIFAKLVLDSWKRAA